LKKPTLTAVALAAVLRALTPLGAANAVEQADIYVAPLGKDTDSGTVDAPFATLARAREAVRAMVAGGLKKNILVLISGGTYAQAQPLVFGPQDSGTVDRSITYAARPGEKVILSGGRRITGWKKGDGEIWTTELADVKAGNWYFRQLFVSGRRAVRARTPNSSEANPGWWKIATSSATDAPPPREAAVTVQLGPVGESPPVPPWSLVQTERKPWLRATQRPGAASRSCATQRPRNRPCWQSDAANQRGPCCVRCKPGGQWPLPLFGRPRGPCASPEPQSLVRYLPMVL
jgi:hypothetical protein